MDNFFVCCSRAYLIIILYYSNIQPLISLDHIVPELNIFSSKVLITNIMLLSEVIYNTFYLRFVLY